MFVIFQSICPGMVQTDILFASEYKITEGMTADEFYSNVPHLKCQDICDAIVYILGTPPHVQVCPSSINACRS
jgi:NADP-dependent 3-hydroxy acid dehydrogenase YdfG